MLVLLKSLQITLLLLLAKQSEGFFLDWFFDFGYNSEKDCFTSTRSILRAQVNDIKSNSSRDTYTICANTKIDVRCLRVVEMPNDPTDC